MLRKYYEMVTWMYLAPRQQPEGPYSEDPTQLQTTISQENAYHSKASCTMAKGKCNSDTGKTTELPQLRDCLAIHAFW